MTKFLVILELILIAARVAVKIFEALVPPAAGTALTWACIIFGLLTVAFVGAEFYNKIKGKSKKDKED